MHLCKHVLNLVKKAARRRVRQLLQHPQSLIGLTVTRRAPGQHSSCGRTPLVLSGPPGGSSTSPPIPERSPAPQSPNAQPLDLSAGDAHWRRVYEPPLYAATAWAADDAVAAAPAIDSSCSANGTHRLATKWNIHVAVSVCC
eukprot:SAG31_NODE_2258_length_6069_cov_21.781072_7_plen_142_part_00